MKKIITRITEFITWAQKTRPARTFTRFGEVGGSILAGGMSIQALLAVFAGLWLAFGTFAFYLRKDPQLIDVIILHINTAIPGLIGESGAANVKELLNTPGISLGNLVASISLLFVAVAWFTRTRTSIRLVYGLDTVQYGNPILLKLKDLATTGIFAVLLLVAAGFNALALTLSGNFLAGFSLPAWVSSGGSKFLSYLVIFCFDVLLLFLLNRFLAKVSHIRAKRILIGCIPAGIMLMVVKLLSNILLVGATKNPLLASFAMLIGLLIWFNIICSIVLLSASWIATGEDKELGLAKEKQAKP